MNLLEDISPASAHACEARSLQFDTLASNGALAKPMHAKAVATSSAMQTKLIVTGLFAGIGGLEEGFRQAGHDSTMLCEFDPLARYVLKSTSRARKSQPTSPI